MLALFFFRLLQNISSYLKGKKMTESALSIILNCRRKGIRHANRMQSRSEQLEQETMGGR
jgi:hypothetical protein